MNNSLLVITAAAGLDLPNPGSLGELPGFLLRDVLLIVGAGIGLLLVLILGAYLVMKRRRQNRRHHGDTVKVYRQPKIQTNAGSDQASRAPGPPHSSSAHDRRRYKHRVRRRGHRSRNPTLAQTGGLPPLKAPEPSEPS
jgi:hypothetical protein